MTQKINYWKYVIFCMVCGGKLSFQKSTELDAKPQEGTMWCDTGHPKLSISGGFDVCGRWCNDMRMPRLKPND